MIRKESTAAIYVLFNPDIDLFIRSLNSVLGQVGMVYIVDNSPNGAVRFDDYEKKGTVYLHSGENIGIAAALNIGVLRAIEDGFSWALLLDQDSVPSSQMVDIMSKALNKEDYLDLAIVAPSINERRSSVSTRVRLEFQTSGSVIDLSCYQQLGGFNEELFIYGVDFEYCIRLNLYGKRILQVNNALMEHNYDDNLLKAKFYKVFEVHISHHNHFRNYFIFRNYLWLISTYRNNIVLRELNLRRDLLIRIIKIVLFEAKKCLKVRYIIKGVLDYLKGNLGPGPMKIKQNYNG